MLSDQGHIVLTDFGSAKMLDVMEKTRSIAGTPQYLAPEVLRGEPYSFSADWWSSGILLYEMLVGKVGRQREVGGGGLCELCECAEYLTNHLKSLLVWKPPDPLVLV